MQKRAVEYIRSGKARAARILGGATVAVLLVIWPFNWKGQWKIYGTKRALFFNSAGTSNGLFALGFMYLVVAQCAIVGTIARHGLDVNLIAMTTYWFMSGGGCLALWCGYILDKWQDDTSRCEWILKFAAKGSGRRIREVLGMAEKEGDGVLRMAIEALPPGVLLDSQVDIKSNILRHSNRQVRIAAIGHMAGKGKRAGTVS